MSVPNQQKTEPIPPTPAHDVPDAAPGSGVSPGDAHGVPVVSEAAAPGTSEGSPPVPAIAPPGLADGENDVAVPPTTSF